MRKRQRSSLPDSSRSRRSRRRWPLGDRSGQVLALFAVTSIPLFAIMALAIDWGLLLTARDEAQRAADSGALAGAAMFKGCSLLTCAAQAQPAEDTAIAYAMKNRVRDIPIAEEEVTVQVDVSERLVRVFVDRAGVPTFFAHFLGIATAPIGAVAAAKISAGGVGQCVMPFWGADLWRDGNGDENQIPEEGEEWVWGDQEGIDLTPDPDDLNPPSAPGSCPDGWDCYQPLQPDGYGTGYGSKLRDGGDQYTEDYGRQVVIEAGPPNGAGALGEMMAPGNFGLWKVPLPTLDEDGNWTCDSPNDTPNLPELQDLIEGDIPCSCPVSLDDQHDVKPGGSWNPIANSIQARLDSDETNTRWDETTQDLVCSLGSGEACFSSTRVVSVGLANPTQIVDLAGASVDVDFNNLARILLESVDGPPDKIVYARFLGFAPGGEGPTTGNLVEYLRLVE